MVLFLEAAGYGCVVAIRESEIESGTFDADVTTADLEVEVIVTVQRCCGGCGKNHGQVSVHIRVWR